MSDLYTPVDPVDMPLKFGGKIRVDNRLSSDAENKTTFKWGRPISPHAGIKESAYQT